MDIIEKKQISSVDQKEVEIKLADVIKFAKDNWTKMLLGSLIGLILGALYAFSKPNIYKVEVTVMPEYQSRGSSGLGAASAFAGLGLENTNAPDAIRPDLYPNVLQSVPFGLYMLNQPVYSKKFNTKTTVQDFIIKTSTLGVLDRILGVFTVKDESNVGEGAPKNSVGALQVTSEQDGLVKTIQGSVTSTYDRKTGILAITAIQTDPIVSATLAQLSLDYLTNYITAYRTDKARKRVIFLTNQVGDAKRRYQAAEYALSNYRDQNRSLYLNTAKLDEQRLQSNYLLEQSVYNDLAKQLEQAKIKVNEETPTFKTLQPPVVPLHKSGPKRTMIMFGCAIVGAAITLSILLFRQVLLSKHSV